jgi:MoxR-like ATPase
MSAFTSAVRRLLLSDEDGVEMPAEASPIVFDDDAALFESGETLVARVLDAITLRRSVLITGPRGSGKTYCAREAIQRAEQAGIIAGHHFLQGNREINRDYLSEDVLIIDDEEAAAPAPSPRLAAPQPAAQPLAVPLLVAPPLAAAPAAALRAGGPSAPASVPPAAPAATGQRVPRPRLQDALVLRYPNKSRQEMQAERVKRGHPHFPGVKSLTNGEQGTWERGEWVVLFLDEINRFGDGLLDSLLSLTEERIVVHRGDKLHVPVILVATANPPGYDVTAKKLSPPLQARISRAYRVSQPSHENLVYRLLPAQINGYSLSYQGAGGDVPKVAPRIRKLVSGAALCLWGLPDANRRGIGFLTPSTRFLLHRASRHPALERDLTDLGELVTFGPDARSVGDWIGCAMGIARDRWKTAKSLGLSVPAPEVTTEILLECALETLAHKVRENFNEGAEPAKVAKKESLVLSIVRVVLEDGAVSAVFDAPYETAVKVITGYDLEENVLAAAADSSKPRPPELELALGLVEALGGREHRRLLDSFRSVTPEKQEPQAAATVVSVGFRDMVLVRQLLRRASEEKLDALAAHIRTFCEGSAQTSVDPSELVARLVEDDIVLREWSETLHSQARSHKEKLSTLGAFSQWAACAVALVSRLHPRGAPERDRRTWFPVFAELWSRLGSSATEGEKRPPSPAPAATRDAKKQEAKERDAKLQEVLERCLEELGFPLPGGESAKAALAVFFDETAAAMIEDALPSARRTLAESLGALKALRPPVTAAAAGSAQQQP